MVVLDVTIVTIALPSAQADLGFDADSRPWVMTAYALAFGSLLPLGGKVSDLIGRKWTFSAGVAGFAAASALGGAASSFDALVGARAMQGVFAALLAPAALLTMAPSFATATRDAGVASALVNASQQIGGSLGLALLSTLFADAVSGYTSAAGTSIARAHVEAAVHGYTTAFWWAAGILAAGAITAVLLFESRPDGVPAAAMRRADVAPCEPDQVERHCRPSAGRHAHRG
jgi:MFS family permease